MSKTIPGVPESLTREQYLSFFTAASIDPLNTMQLTFEPDGIHAVVFERQADGSRLIAKDGYAKHTIFIPVVDDEVEGA